MLTCCNFDNVSFIFQMLNFLDTHVHIVVDRLWKLARYHDVYTDHCTLHRRTFWERIQGWIDKLAILLASLISRGVRVPPGLPFPADSLQCDQHPPLPGAAPRARRDYVPAPEPSSREAVGWAIRSGRHRVYLPFPPR